MAVSEHDSASHISIHENAVQVAMAIMGACWFLCSATIYNPYVPFVVPLLFAGSLRLIDRSFMALPRRWQVYFGGPVAISTLLFALVTVTEGIYW